MVPFRIAVKIAGLICLTWLGIIIGNAADKTQALTGPSLSTSDKGIVITVPDMGSFTVGYPILEGKKIVSCQSDNAKATVTYDGGVKLDVQIDGTDAVSYHYNTIPAGVKKVEMEMPLPAALAKGGSFRVNDGKTTLFPATPPTDIDLYEDHQVHRLGIHDGMLKSFVLHPPEHSFLEIEDRRESSSGDFLVRLTSPLTPDMSLHLGDRRAETAPANHERISIPRAPKPLVIDGNAAKWSGLPVQQIPASRLVDGNYKFADQGESSAPDLVSATFQTCWDDKNIYFLVSVIDSTPMHNNSPRNDKLWTGDGVEVYLGGEGLDVSGDFLPGDRQITVGVDEISGALVQLNGLMGKPPIQAVVVPSKGGYTVETAIPFSLLGFTPTEGHPLRLDVGINDSAEGRERRCQLMWNGTNQNSVVRTDWGKAVLSK